MYDRVVLTKSYSVNGPYGFQMGLINKQLNERLCDKISMWEYFTDFYTIILSLPSINRTEYLQTLKYDVALLIRMGQ